MTVSVEGFNNENEEVQLGSELGQPNHCIHF